MFTAVVVTTTLRFSLFFRSQSPRKFEKIHQNPNSEWKQSKELMELKQDKETRKKLHTTASITDAW